MSVRIAADPIVIGNWVRDSFNPGLDEISQGVTDANTAISMLEAKAPNLGIIRTNTASELQELGTSATTVLTKGATAVAQVVEAILSAGGSTTAVEIPETKTFALDGAMLEDGDVVEVDEPKFVAAAADIKAAHKKISTACESIKADLSAISEDAWQGESRESVVQVINKLIGEGAEPAWAEESANHDSGVVTPWAEPADQDLQSVSSASLANTCNSIFAVLNNIRTTDKAVSEA